jgi:pilus assembly protein CpaF
MGLRSRLMERLPGDRLPLLASGREEDNKDLKKEIAFSDLKAKIHFQMLNLLDLSRLSEAPDSILQEDLRKGIEIILAEERLALPLPEKERLCKEIRDELLGYGPLEPLLHDSSVGAILVNGYDQVYVERRGKLERSSIRFTDNAHLQKIIEKIASGVGRRIDESSPMVDARLPDGSRVNAIIPPLALDGPTLSIRKFAKVPIRVQDLIAFGSITPEIAQVLEAMVKARLNILISGGTGTGKTVFFKRPLELHPQRRTHHHH